MLNASTKTLQVDYSLPEFTIAVDSLLLRLRYDLGALMAYEKRTGSNPLTASFNLNVTNLPAFLWAGLQRYNPEITEDQLKLWITPRNTEDFADLAIQAFRASLPDADLEEEKTPDPPSA